MKKIIGSLLLIALLPAAFMVGCNSSKTPASPAGDTPTFTSTPGTPTATKTVTTTVTTTATGINTATVTATKTATNSPTVTETKTATDSPTVTATATTTNTPGNTATVTMTPNVLASTQPATAPSLGTMGDTYAVLSSTSITAAGTGATVCSGVAGVPTGGSITGFLLCGVGNTTIDYTDATQALLDLGVAYNNSSPASQTGGLALPADIGGLTIYPGLYTATVSTSYALGITGNVTLSANGITNPVFLFQVPAALTTATSSQVILGTGVSADNIFWYVGAAATLGTYSTFSGNIMSSAEIHVLTSANMNGRAMCQNAVVALDSNTTVTMP